MKTHFVILVCSAVTCHFSKAENFNSVSTTGNIVTTGGNSYVYAANGSVQARLFMSTSGYLSVGTSITAGSTITGAGVQGNSWLYSPGYVSSPQGFFGNTLTAGGSSATGSLSSAFGASASATSYSSIAVGRNNETTAYDGSASTAGSWVDKDPLFVIGNGTGVSGTGQYRNAWAVYKDGTVTMSKAQGDISMGQFGN